MELVVHRPSFAPCLSRTGCNVLEAFKNERVESDKEVEKKMDRYPPRE